MKRQAPTLQQAAAPHAPESRAEEAAQQALPFQSTSSQSLVLLLPEDFIWGLLEDAPCGCDFSRYVCVFETCGWRDDITRMRTKGEQEGKDRAVELATQWIQAEYPFVECRTHRVLVDHREARRVGSLGIYLLRLPCPEQAGAAARAKLRSAAPEVAARRFATVAKPLEPRASWVDVSSATESAMLAMVRQEQEERVKESDLLRDGQFSQVLLFHMVAGGLGPEREELLTRLAEALPIDVMSRARALLEGPRTLDQLCAMVEELRNNALGAWATTRQMEALHASAERIMRLGGQADAAGDDATLGGLLVEAEEQQLVSDDVDRWRERRGKVVSALERLLARSRHIDEVDGLRLSVKNWAISHLPPSCKLSRLGQDVRACMSQGCLANQRGDAESLASAVRLADELWLVGGTVDDWRGAAAAAAELRSRIEGFAAAGARRVDEADALLLEAQPWEHSLGSWEPRAALGQFAADARACLAEGQRAHLGGDRAGIHAAVLRARGLRLAGETVEEWARLLEAAKQRVLDALERPHRVAEARALLEDVRPWAVDEWGPMRQLEERHAGALACLRAGEQAVADRDGELLSAAVVEADRLGLEDGSVDAWRSTLRLLSAARAEMHRVLSKRRRGVAETEAALAAGRPWAEWAASEVQELEALAAGSRDCLRDGCRAEASGDWLSLHGALAWAEELRLWNPDVRRWHSRRSALRSRIWALLAPREKTTEQVDALLREARLWGLGTLELCPATRGLERLRAASASCVARGERAAASGDQEELLGVLRWARDLHLTGGAVNRLRHISEVNASLLEQVREVLDRPRRRQELDRLLRRASRQNLCLTEPAAQELAKLAADAKRWLARGMKAEAARDAAGLLEALYYADKLSLTDECVERWREMADLRPSRPSTASPPDA